VHVNAPYLIIEDVRVYSDIVLQNRNIRIYAVVARDSEQIKAYFLILKMKLNFILMPWMQSLQVQKHRAFWQ